MTFYVIVMAALTFNFWSGPQRWADFNLPSLALASFLGIVSTVMAISLLYLAIEMIGSAHVSIFSTIEPAVTVALAWLILGEPLVAWQLFGHGPDRGRNRLAEPGPS